MAKKRSRSLIRPSGQNRVLAALLLVASIAVLGIGSRWLSTYLASPVLGALTGTHVLGWRSGFDMSAAAFTDGYASFTYPKSLSAAPSGRIAPPIVASYVLRYHSTPRTCNLAVTITRVPSGRLSDNNAYQFRRVHPEVYKESSETFNGVRAAVMTDTTATGFSKVGFLVDGEYQAAVALYGNDQSGPADLQATFAMIMGSWHWQVR